MHNRGTVQGIGGEVDEVKAHVGVAVPGKKKFSCLYEIIFCIKIHINPVVTELAYREKTAVLNF